MFFHAWPPTLEGETVNPLTVHDKRWVQVDRVHAHPTEAAAVEFPWPAALPLGVEDRSTLWLGRADGLDAEWINFRRLRSGP